jgi:hypothetical protein
LPTQEEIDDMNRNLLAHPEFYTESCYYDSQALRRFRLCPLCATQDGVMTLAVHDGACKQWPGNAREHRHQFCFKCTGQWGVACRHDNDCRDPGIQQVRRVAVCQPCGPGGGGEGRTRTVERLEIGLVDSAAYMACLQRGASPDVRDFPPTVFPDGSQVSGAARQAALGMTDRAAMLQEMRRGTA